MMLNGKQKQISGTSGSGQLLRVVIILVALLLLSGAVPAEAQKWPYSFSTDGWSPVVNPVDHTPYYLPYYDGPRVLDYICLNYGLYRCGHRYHSGYWYPWTFRWGRYDVPNYSWWTFGEGFFDEYGTGGIWMTGEPSLTTELKAIQTIERERVAARAMVRSTRITRGSGFRSTGISASSRGSSIGSSGGGLSSGGGSKGGKK